MYQVIRIIPASVLFQHDEQTQILAEHKYNITAWISCYLWHNSLFLPCHIRKAKDSENLKR